MASSGPVGGTREEPALPSLADVADRTTEAVDPGRAEECALVRQFRLAVTAGPDQARGLVSTRERVVVGTHASADLVLADRAVSRFHCELVVRDGRVVVRDLGSRNGTLVNGVPILEAPLAGGEVLALGHDRLRFELGEDHVRLPLSARTRFGRMVGGSPAMRRVFALLERAAASDAIVLLEGETGTGKDAAAESVHGASARRDGPFVVLDCGAVPGDLIESELFGHLRGAFTGAVAAREGAFEAASGGTLFLDEIGELDVAMQPKLLRAIDRREIKPVGSDRAVGVDVRIVAATNRNLRQEVNEHRFRSDLYYRLAVVQIELPPLRARLDDLPALVDCLLEEVGAAGRPEAAFVRSAPFRAELARHSWPGNVRELRNHVERCLALREQASFEPGPGPAGGARSDGLPPIDAGRPLREARDAHIRAFEAAYLEQLLERSGDNVSAAARAAGVDRIHLHRLLRRHGLR